MNFDFIFVIAFGRSGSTLLQGVLNSIPGVLIRGENHNALYALWQATALVVKTRHHYPNDKGRDARDPWFGSETVDPNGFAEGLKNAFVASVLRPDPTVRVIGFKEIRYGPPMTAEEFEGYLDFVRQTFRRAAFVFNTRRVEDAVGSAWWKDNADAASILSESARRFRSYAARHPADCFQVHYDDYVRDPDRLQPLFDFLGATFDRERVKAVIKLPHSWSER